MDVTNVIVKPSSSRVRSQHSLEVEVWGVGGVAVRPENSQVDGWVREWGDSLEGRRIGRMWAGG